MDETPRRNLAKLRHWLRVKTGLKHAKPENTVLVGMLKSPALPLYLRYALRKLAGPVVVAGSGYLANLVIEAQRANGGSAESRPFDWSSPSDVLAAPTNAHVILCLVPMTQSEWQRVTELKREFGARLMLLPEILLPLTRLAFLQQRLEFYFKKPEEILPFYLGDEFFGPLDQLAKLFPIRGKSVIEFGPFDGCQTAGLVHLGASSVTCIEARAENVIKTANAAEIFGWSQVRVIMDDFHNADALKYGRHDLAFAHGVYYHAIAPFVFLENLCSLSDTIFIGGFCATDDLPASPWLEMHHAGSTYRVKPYHETSDFTAGVNPIAFFFHAADLMRFFSERGYHVEIISDERSTVTAGQFLRFIATRPPETTAI